MYLDRLLMHVLWAPSPWSSDTVQAVKAGQWIRGWAAEHGEDRKVILGRILVAQAAELMVTKTA
jgi:hypothetical protein